MVGLKECSLCVLLLMHLGPLKAYSSTTYFFNNYPISQKQFSNPRNQNIYSLEGTIVTDGTKGFINTANFISLNISLKLGSSLVKTLNFSSDPDADYFLSEFISANNLIATESHLGIVETWRNSTNNSLGINLGNKNLTILDPVDNTQFLVIKNQFDWNDMGRMVFEYGSEQSSGWPSPQNSWRFYNYWAPTNAPEPDFGSYFPYFDLEDQIHINNEMIAEGFGNYAWASDQYEPTIHSGTWVIASNVPEPSSFSLLLAGGAVLMAGRRRKQD